ncbi:MAG: SAM-dependent methyltransferase [Thalassobius sp.]|nr:SAM-dependent methyltransferase [Thalassovita sp.]
MTDKIFTAKHYLNYQLKATNAHGIHSPFVFKLYNEVINSEKYFYAFDDIEDLRMDLLVSSKVIEVKDFGAGSKVFKSNQRSVSKMAKYALSDEKTGQMLFRLIEFLKPETIFELGTSLGINTLYLAKAWTQGKVTTFEGCPETLKIAQQNFEKLKANIHTVEGNIDETLPEELKKHDKVDFVFFDANHRKSATLKYFHACLEKVDENTVFVFDDIYWTKDMGEAWDEIKNHHEVMLSIDLFDLGLVFFRKNQPKQHFLLRF